MYVTFKTQSSIPKWDFAEAGFPYLKVMAYTENINLSQFKLNTQSQSGIPLKQGSHNNVMAYTENINLSHFKLNNQSQSGISLKQGSIQMQWHIQKTQMCHF